MGQASGILKPQELTEFRKLNTTLDNVEIPARPESRSVTDKKGLIIFGVAILLLMPFLIYTLVKADFRRFEHGYDDCGNLCGLNNTAVKDVSCSGRNYPFEKYSYDFKCMSSCPSNTEPILGRCYATEETKSRGRVRRDYNIEEEFEDQQELDDALEHCNKNWWKFVVSILITIGLCLVVIMMLRYAPEIVVWGVIVFTVIVFIALTILTWFYYVNNRKLLAGAVIITIITIIIIIILIVLFKKIGLVIILYKEATKALGAMPLMILVPIVGTIVQILILIAFGLTTMFMLTSAELHKLSEQRYRYKMNGVMIFSMAFNFFITLWAMVFIAGVQYMTIAGSVGAWYFSKNKQYLDSPIWTSFTNSVRFHLGTISLGSLIITLMCIIKMLIRSLFKNEKAQALLECCCSNIEAFLKFLSQNSYIVTAIHGQSFLRSGKRAAKLLLSNASSVIAINSVGDFVLGMVVLILLVVSTAISYALFSSLGVMASIPTGICFVVNIIIISIMFGIFSTVIDTLFICFCEDKQINDGISRPYLMSRGLMEFVENSKKVYDKQE